MTLPDLPSQQDQINAASQSSPLAERLQLLNDNGHGWLDPQLQTTLAQSSTSDQQMLGAAQQASTTITQQLSQVGQGALSAVRTVFDDPVLHKQPSAALAVHQFLTQQAGWMPVEAPDLQALQRSMQGLGYGKGLNVSGVWTPDWQNQYYTMSQNHLDAKRTSNDGAGFSFAHALKGFLSSIMPSHAIPALIGAAKALPSDIRSVISDNVAHLVDLPHELTKNPLSGVNSFVNPVQSALDTYGSKQRGSAAATVGAGIESLANHQTITPVEFNSEHGFHRLVESLNTILTVLPIMRLGSTVADAGGQAIARGLFTDMGEGAAQRGPGLISNMIYRPAGYQTVDGEAQLIGDRGLLALKSFDNIPGLKQMLPPLRNATSAGQRYWYYEARPFAASLYRMPIVNAAGHVLTQTTFTGAMIRGDANVVNRIEGGKSNFANTVYAQKPYTGPLGFALDMSSAVAHGEMPFRAPIAAKTAEEALTAAAKAKAYEPLVLPTLSQQIGATVKGAHEIYDAMLGRIGVIGAWERGTGLKYADTVAAARVAGLDSTDVLWHMQAKVDELAAHDAAEQLTRTSGELGVPREQDHLATAVAVRNDPPALGSARAILLDSPARLTTRFRQDATRISQRAEARTGDLVNLMKGRRIAYPVLNTPELAAQLIHPGTFQVIKDARDEAAFNAHLGMQEAPPKVIANREFLAANNPQPDRGSIGIGRLDSLTQPEALSKINRLTSSFRAAGGLASERAAGLTSGNLATTLPQVDRAAIDTHLVEAAKLALQMHMDPEFLPRDPETVINVLRERANHLASPVAVPLDAPAELTGAVSDLRNLGLRLVAGTGIGFDLVPPVIDPAVVDGGVRTIRKVADTLGLGSTYADPEDVALQHRMDWIKRLQGRADKGQLPDYPGWTWDHVLRHVYDNLPNRKTLGGVAGGVFKFQDRRWQKIVRAILPADATEQDVTDKLHVLEEQLAGQKSILDTPYKDFVKAATSPAKGLVNFATGTPEAEPLFTEAQANLMYLDMLRAAGDKKMWLAGLSKLDGLKRAGFSFMGQPAANNKVLMRVATLPNNLVRFRNKFRFEIDPEFAARRQFKQGLKLSMSQVPYTMTPFDSMVKQGTLRSDIQWAERNFPEYHKNLSAGWDTNDQALYDSDVLGIYNPRHWIAYGGGWFKRMGMNDAQAKDAVTKALTYGSRTALERSVGTIFYPFSFEKTLYRQLGTYLLDNPGQRFLVDAASQAYDTLNQHAHIGQWIQDRLPILKELDRLNAFDHGVGPGMVGGIDAPYARLVWNLFGPQHIQNPNDTSTAVIQSAIPLFGEVNRMLLGYSPYSGTAKAGGLLEQQAKVTFAAAIQGKDDVERWITGRSPSPWSPPAPALDFQAQQNQAWQMRTMLISKLAGTIDYNYHHPNAEISIAKDDSVPGDLRGKPIIRSTIDEIVHRFYPDYDPTAAQSIAVTKKTERDRAIGQLADRSPALANLYSQFAVSADKFITYKQRREFTPDQMATLAQLTDQYRAYAVAVSETDPSFLRFYNSYFASQLGPIEEVTN